MPTGSGKKGMTWQEALLGQWLNTGYDDPVYEVVNGNTDAINKRFSNESVSGSTLMGTDSRFLLNLNETEKGVYNYIHFTRGKDAADRFLSDLQGELNARQRKKEETYWAEEAEKHPVNMSVFSTLTKPLSVFSYAQQAEKVLSGEKLDPNAGYNRGSYTANAIRGAVSKKIEKSGNWGKAGSYGYDLAMSMSDFLYTSAITGGMEPLALTVMGTEAAADSVLAAKERGLSDERSFLIGTAAGVIEAATEKVGFDALFKTGVRSLGRTGFRRYILRNAGAEAAEEGASDLLNWIADDLYDLVTETKESEFKQLVSVYEENGLDHTKALLSALGDRGKELGLDTLGGFLSGLFLSGGKSGYNAVEFNRMGQEALDTGSYRDYISLGLLADHDSEAYRYAEEIRAKLNAGRAVTNIEMGQLTAAVYADALGVGEKWSAEAREEVDEDIWDRVFDEEEDDDLQRELAEELGLDEPAGQEVLTDETTENIVESNDGIPPVTSAVSRALIAEVQARGDKISPDEVLGITRDLSGQIVWLEKGHLDGKPSGLAHIMHDHEVHFNRKGIASSDIPSFVMTTVAKGKVVGYQGKGTGRAIYEIVYKGVKYQVAVSVGSNGYIVGANPCKMGGYK